MTDAFALLPNEIITEILKIGPPRRADLIAITEIAGFWAQIAESQIEKFDNAAFELALTGNDYIYSRAFIKSQKITTVKFQCCFQPGSIKSAVFRRILQSPAVRSVFAENCGFSNEAVARDACVEFAKKPGFLQLSCLYNFHDLRSDKQEDEDFSDLDDDDDTDIDPDLDVLPEFGQILRHWLDLTVFPAHMMRFAFSTRGRGTGLNWFSKYGMKNSCSIDGVKTFFRFHPNDETKRIQIYCRWSADMQILEMSVVSMLASVAAEFAEYSTFLILQNGECYEDFDGCTWMARRGREAERSAIYD